MIDGLDIVAILVLAAFFAGFVDAIAGGGGLITVSVLLLCGFSPLQALATNKLQVLFGAGTAALTFGLKGHVDLWKQKFPALIALSAGALGALLISIIPADDIRIILPFLLIAVALFFWLKPGLDDESRAERMRPSIFVVTIVPLIGFYDGFFGPGTGSFFMLAFVSLSGFGILKATAHTKLLNFASNLGGFIVFAIAGSVVWKVGLAMGIAQIIGAQIGTRLAISKGAKLIKPLLVFTCLVLAAKLLWDYVA
ncbi:MAG: TSUP family transporter [Pseudomonadota bacterium]